MKPHYLFPSFPKPASLPFPISVNRKPFTKQKQKNQLWLLPSPVFISSHHQFPAKWLPLCLFFSWSPQFHSLVEVNSFLLAYDSVHLLFFIFFSFSSVSESKIDYIWSLFKTFQINHPLLETLSPLSLQVTQYFWFQLLWQLFLIYSLALFIFPLNYSLLFFFLEFPLFVLHSSYISSPFARLQLPSICW